MANPTKTPKTKAKPETTFRAHFRTTADDKPQTMLVTTADGIGGVHKEVYAEHRTDKVDVRIDKVKVVPAI